MNINKIKEALRETANRGNITRICVWDFDGTLVDTPTPDTGEAEYKQKTGKDWPHKGWWSRPESLDTSIFDMPIIPSVIAAYQSEKQNPQALMVMLTGRLRRLSNEVEKILAMKGLRFDQYLYNNGGNTLQSKIASLDQLLATYQNVKSLAVWDDRTEHVDSFKAWGAAHPDLDFKITVVPGNHH